MSQLQLFLVELSDHELVNFCYYRYDQFLKGSKEKIDKELEIRGIDKENLIAYHQKNAAQITGNCPRCGSSKFYNSTERETITYSYASVDIDVDYKTCLICLFAEDKDSGYDTHRYIGPIGFIKKLVNRKR